ncbi:ribosome assembly cofactor RimP [Mycoplasma buteonis]|uniref:ribosome assembly cofactor RimP n=1 Tax=Mycoplasma buteonis TaxID=171280 RepID=UPI00055A3870|nr:ribosome assembly cofactor RimP [Mycoplasma buteonis]
MDYKKLLNEQFGNKVLEAKLTNFSGTTLEVVLDTDNLNEVENFSRSLSQFLETQTWFKDEYNLEVLSRGDDLNLDKHNLSSHVGEMVKINTIKSFESLNTFVVELLEDNETEVLVRWNKKGQFRKIKLSKDNISSIEKYIKF